MNRLFLIIIIAACSIGMGVIVWFMFDLPFNDGSRMRNGALFGQYGDFVGGLLGTIFTICSFFILYITLIQQRTQFRLSINQQSITFQKERFESKFFEMVKFHRENVQEMYVPRTEKGKY